MSGCSTGRDCVDAHAKIDELEATIERVRALRDAGAHSETACWYDLREALDPTTEAP